MKYVKYLLAGAVGFFACFALMSLGLSQAVDIHTSHGTFTCFKSD